MSRYDVRAPFFVGRHLPYRHRQRSPIHGLPAARLAYGDDGTAFPLSSVSFRQVMAMEDLVHPWSKWEGPAAERWEGRSERSERRVRQAIT